MMGERLRDDESGLSPVLGVVMLLGITVVLAATIGAFAFKLQADMTGPTPQVSITAEQGIHTSNPTGSNRADVKTVTLTHTNGEPIDTDNLIVTVNRKQAYNLTRYENVPGETAGNNDGDAELFPFEDKNGETKETFALGDSVRIVHGDHSAFVDDPSTTLNSRNRYSNNNVEAPEESMLYPNGHHQDSDDVALHTGDVIRLVYTSESGGGGEVLFEHTVV